MNKKTIAVLSTFALCATLLAPGTSGTVQTAEAANAPTIPVILVPGIGGSQLWGIPNKYNNDSGNGSDIVWVDKVADHASVDLLVNDAELTYNLSMKRATSGAVYDMVPLYSDVRIWALKDDYGLKGISYLDADKWDMSSALNLMVDTLKSNGYVAGKTLFGLPYDWRQEYSKEFSNITAAINRALSASGQSKVAIVAHSQGGLLFKSYLLANPAMQSKIDSFVTLGTPFLGAPKALRALSPKLGGFNFDIPVMGNDTGHEIAKTSPAVYHLAPSYRYEALMFQKYGRSTLNSYNSPSYVPATPSQGYYTQMRSFVTDTSLFDWSTNRHTGWDYSAPSVESYHIVGDMVSTEVAFDYDYSWLFGNEVDYIMKAGDGTVPLISAQNPGSSTAPVYYVHQGASGKAVDHMGLVKDANVIQKVMNILRDQPSAPVTGIDTTPNTSLNSTSFVAYSLTGEEAELEMDVLVTNLDTGGQETYTFKGGKYIRQGDAASVAVRTMDLDGQFDIQFIAPENANLDIEVVSRKNATYKFRTYETGPKGVSNKLHYGWLNHKAKEETAIKQNNGKRQVLKGGQVLKEKESRQ